MVIKRNRSVSSTSRILSLRNEEDGFTLLEAVIALGVTVLCLMLMSFSFNHFQHFQTQADQGKQLEFHLFLYQLEHDLKGKEFVSNNSTSMTFNEPKANGTGTDQILYQKRFTVFRREVNTTGYQPMLTEVEAVEIQREKHVVFLKVVFLNGERHHAKIDLSETMQSYSSQ